MSDFSVHMKVLVLRSIFIPFLLIALFKTKNTKRRRFVTCKKLVIFVE